MTSATDHTHASTSDPASHEFLTDISSNGTSDEGHLQLASDKERLAIFGTR